MNQLPKHESYLNPHNCEVLDVLVDAYQRKLPPYDTAVLPQEYRPERMREDGGLYGTKEHAAFFFNACAYMRSTNAGDAIKKLTRLFDERPEFFDMEKLASMEAGEVAGALRNYGLGGIGTQNAIFWVENAQRMMERFDGDPRKIFEGCSSYEEAVERVRNEKDKKNGKGFLGFQEKMASMLLYFFTDEGLMTPTGFAWPMPSDRHAVRIFSATRMVDVPSTGESFYYDRLLQPIRDISQEYADARGVDPVEVTNAVWQLSSEFCSQAPGNQSKMEQSGEMKPVEVNPELAMQQRRWSRSCGRCFLRPYCELWVALGNTNKYKTIEATLKKDNFHEQVSFSDMGLV